MGEEQRRFARGWRGRIRIGAFRLLKPRLPAVVCKNISAGGLLVETHEALETGARVIYELVLPGLQAFAESRGRNPIPYQGDILRGEAEVMRVRPLAVSSRPEEGMWNNGLKFVGLDKDTTFLLDELIHDRAGAKPEWLGK